MAKKGGELNGSLQERRELVYRFIFKGQRIRESMGDQNLTGNILL